MKKLFVVLALGLVGISGCKVTEGILGDLKRRAEGTVQRFTTGMSNAAVDQLAEAFSSSAKKVTVSPDTNGALAIGGAAGAVSAAIPLVVWVLRKALSVAAKKV